MPIFKSPEPQYDEKRVLAELDEQPTGEMDLRKVARALKAQHRAFTKTKKRSDLYKLGAVLAGVLGIGGGGVGTSRAHDKVDVLKNDIKHLQEDLAAAKAEEERLRGKLEDEQLELAVCCDRRK